MKQRLVPKLPCEADVVATRLPDDDIWVVEQEGRRIAVRATTKNIRALKRLLDQMLANTPKRLRKD